MQVRSEYDRQGLQAIGRIVATVLEELCLHAAPGMTTGDLDARAGQLLERHGALPTPRKEYHFPGNLCVSVNDEVVHGVPGERVLREGDLVKLDLTADKRGFVADAARMVSLGDGGDKSRRIADSARRACLCAIAGAHPGVRLLTLGSIVQDVAQHDGFTVVKELCGHGVGRRTHEEPEVPNYPDHSNYGVLREGMVITVEPIVSAGDGGILTAADGWTIATRDGSLAGHYEETIIVGRDGAEVVTVC